MSDPGNVASIRTSILGADRGFKVIDGGGGGGGPGGAAPVDGDECPIAPLGHADGVYWFLDFAGQPRKLSARDLANRANLVSLFGGDDTWMRRQFPKKKEIDGENGEKKTITIDFIVNAVVQELISRASRRGLWGKAITFRQPGVWKGVDNLPIVHCGDAVLIGGDWVKPGFRTGNQIWVAAEAIARPATPCGPDIARRLQEDLQTAWAYRSPEGAIAIIGSLYSGWLCAALDWRTNAFITGPTGSGKTALMRVFRAAWPEHDYSNDTSKAGMEQTIAGKAVPSVIDEAADRNSSAGRDLVDIVLSSSGDEGTKLSRGTIDGKGRVSQVVSSVVMFSIYVPPLQPQHLGRFVIIELDKPEGGADHRSWHRQIAEFARTHGPALWGRAIAAYERYVESLSRFREQLAKANCSPREMDSKGALLAGWYVMTNDGLPTERDLREGVAALGGLLVTAEDAEAEDAPQRCLQHLLASHIQLHRSTDRKPIGELLENAYADAVLDDPEHAPYAAAEQLARNGIRTVRGCQRADPPPDGRQCTCSACWNHKTGKPVPRKGKGAGVWIAKRHPSLDALFKGSDFDEGKWLTAIARSREAQFSSKTIRIGSVTGGAIWLPRATILPAEDPSPDG